MRKKPDSPSCRPTPDLALLSSLIFAVPSPSSNSDSADPRFTLLDGTRAFVQAIYVNGSVSEKAELDALESSALSVMRKLP